MDENEKRIAWHAERATPVVRSKQEAMERAQRESQMRQAAAKRAALSFGR